MRVLISSAGRRVGLIGCFRESFRRLGVAGTIVAVDTSLQAPAIHFADTFFQSPRCDDPDFLPWLRDLVARERIDLIVPTIDPELPVYASAREELRAQGTSVAVSTPETVAICADKRRSHCWLRRHGFPIPEQQGLARALADPLRFPRIVKPRHGSGSAGVRRVESFEELRVLAALAEDQGCLDEYVVEQIAAGHEHTINVFVDAGGVCRAAVPHRRIEVRGGEVSKAATVRHAGLIELARGIAETLPGARGPLSVQCFLASDGSWLLTEMNARFGGGYPLTHSAGARFSDWILEELLALPCSASADWTDGLMMLRYDHEVFLGPDLQPGRNCVEQQARSMVVA
jgi:carbamoyl-phosphate synthase large subunit